MAIREDRSFTSSLEPCQGGRRTMGSLWGRGLVGLLVATKKKNVESNFVTCGPGSLTDVIFIIIYFFHCDTRRVRLLSSPPDDSLRDDNGTLCYFQMTGGGGGGGGRGGVSATSARSDSANNKWLNRHKTCFFLFCFPLPPSCARMV